MAQESESQGNPAAARGAAMALLTAALIVVGGMWWQGQSELASSREEVKKQQDQQRGATRELSRWRRLALRGEVDSLVQRSEQLWPARPQNIDAYKTWLNDAQQLLKRTEDLRRLKAELGQRAQPAGNAAGDRPQDAALRAARRQVGELVDSAQALRNQRAESGLSESDKAEIDQQGLLAEYRLRETRLRVARLERWNFERPDDAWAYRMVEQLVVDLESLADPQTGLIAGSSARFGIGVKRRLAIAERIVSDSVTAHVELWKKRAAAVSESKHYTGLALKPQVGLVPLGPDPVTGLEEFAHVESGSLARRGDDGRLVFEDGTGMVFVLIPESRLSKRGLSTPPFVVVEPFFIAKYETTQGQWQQVSGQNPSTYQAGLSPQVGGGENTTLSLKSPVESISARDMEEFLRRLGLNLPTEAQWECAIGAPDAAGSHRVGKIQQPHLPVTETAMSARGVHGLMGNVSEVCRDPFAATIIPQRPGDGLRLAVLSDALTMRGLGLLEGDPKLGSKIRLPAPLEFRDPRLGFRAARKLAP